MRVNNSIMEVTDLSYKNKINLNSASQILSFALIILKLFQYICKHDFKSNGELFQWETVAGSLKRPFSGIFATPVQTRS